MLKKFFSGVLSSFVGAWLALTVFSLSSVVLSFALIGAFSGDMSTSTVGVQDKSVLHLNMANSFSEKTDIRGTILSILNKSDVANTTLPTMLKALRVAKDNEKIEGVFIECNGTSAGIATLKEIRDALVDFKSSGKWVIAYGYESIAQGDYYVASVADSIYVNPVGAVDIHGISSTLPFFKNLFDKLGVKYQVLRVGTFKSAVEPYIATEASAANRTATEAYAKSLWSTISSEIAESRSISLEKLNGMADSLLMAKPVDYLLENKIVDGVSYKFDFMENLKAKTGLSSADDLRLASPEDVAALDIAKIAIDKVAVVYAVGGIDDGSDEGIVSKDLVDDIIAIAEDDAVKGLVLRVNSPGGSAFGSEQIWAALEKVKKAGKPFAVSMGDYAASGGYYISCGADRIFAEPLTITGSIGIFGLIPCVKELLNDKIGVNFTEISTNKNSSISILEPMTPLQRESMQRMINAGYELFTTRCAEGRGMQIDSLKAIAEGRVWDGATALKIGLVDEMGGLEDAIAYVVEQAKLGEYSVKEYPKVEDEFMKYFKSYIKAEVRDIIGIKPIGLLKYQNTIEEVLERPYVQCIMEPVEIK